MSTGGFHQPDVPPCALSECLDVQTKVKPETAKCIIDSAATGGKSLLSARDVATMLRFERDLGADSAATMILRSCTHII